MKLAIVGSTKLAGNPKPAEIIEAVLDEHDPDEVVSGGAEGIDTMAAIAARKRGIPVTEHLPTRRQWAGPGGFKERNERIAQDCDVLVRIAWAKATTYGSGWTRDRAKQLGKPTREYVID